MVFSTDAEYKRQDDAYLGPTVAFFKDADLVIFDAQYTLSESRHKADWGHSSTYMGTNLALKANIKNMAFYHHEPTYSDFRLVEILESSREFLNAIHPENPPNLFLAREGLSLDMFSDSFPR